MQSSSNEKLIDFREPSAVAELVGVRDFESRIVFTNGCFDLLHPGHISTLCFCDEFRIDGTALVVAVNTDRSVRELKGPDRPIVDELSRASMLAAFSFVDYVVLFDDPTPVRVLEVLRPDLIVKGGDYEGKLVVGHELAAAVAYAPFVDGWSTTDLIGRIRGRRD